MSEVDAEPPRKGRAAKREAILAAASRVFLREGYHRANLDVIAEDAGVSKQTIYNHFKDKEELFLTVIRHVQTSVAGEGQGHDFLQWEANLSVQELLTALAIDLLWVFRQPDLAAFRWLVTAEEARYPQLRTAWNENGPIPVFKRLSAEFTKRTEAGELSMQDPIRATRHFVALIGSDARVMPSDASEDDFRALIAPTIALFLAPYLPKLTRPRAPKRSR